LPFKGKRVALKPERAFERGVWHAPGGPSETHRLSARYLRRTRADGANREWDRD